MNKIKSLNDDIMQSIYIEQLEHKIDLSRVSTIDFLIDSTSVFSTISNDIFADCGVECAGFCGVYCDIHCTECNDFCGVKGNDENSGLETSNPNPWEAIWNQMYVSKIATLK